MFAGVLIGKFNILFNIVMKKSIFVILGVGAMLLSSCAQQAEPTTFQRPVKLYRVQSMRLFERTYPGVVKSRQTVTLAFKMSGQLTNVGVSSGQKVSKGTLIAEIDPTDYKLTLESARAAYLNSKSQFERYSRLITRQAISEQEYESAKAAYKRDRSNYDNATSMLGQTKLFAPFSGIIENCYVDNYQRIQAAEPIVKLINPDDLEVDFVMPENNIDLMKAPHKEFFVTLEAYPTVRFKADMIKFVDASPDGVGVPVTVAFDDASFSAAKYDVRPGFSADVTLSIVNDMASDITAIPITALRGSLDGDADSVWVYNKADSTVMLRGIETGELFGKEMIAVTQGLAPGEEVVTAGVYQLVDGQKVRPLK